MCEARVSWSDSPQVQIVEPVAVYLDGLAQLVCELWVGVYVEQDRSGVADQSVGPARNDASADNTRQRVHPEPAERPGENEADNHENRNCRIRHDV